MSEMREMADKELDAVCGGFLNFLNSVTQTNTAEQIAAAVAGNSLITGGNSGNVAVAQLLGQLIISHI